ncbi:MAG: hypothetical protein ACERKO_03260 [Acetanaerobacterium sp.]
MKIKKRTLIIALSVLTVLILGVFLVLPAITAAWPINPFGTEYYPLGYVGDNSFVLPRDRVVKMSHTIALPKMQRMYDRALATKATGFRFTERDLAEWTIASTYEEDERQALAEEYESAAISADYRPSGSIIVNAV